MKADVKTLAAKSAGSVDLPDEVFGLKPRPDIIQRMVNYQLAKRQQGTHKAPGRSEITGSTAKIYRQKGTGGARHGSRKVNIFRGGGQGFGPQPRSHAMSLPKKVRALALKHALSAKARDKQLVVLDAAQSKDGKTRGMRAALAKLGLGSALIVDGAAIEDKFALAVRNIPNIDVLPVQGINVFDIMRRETLVLTKQAVEALEARFK